MDVTIRFSKTDQFGDGETCYVLKTQSPGGLWGCLETLNGLRDDEKMKFQGHTSRIVRVNSKSQFRAPAGPRARKLPKNHKVR